LPFWSQCHLGSSPDCKPTLGPATANILRSQPITSAKKTYHFRAVPDCVLEPLLCSARRFCRSASFECHNFRTRWPVTGGGSGQRIL
jgi:hypothetical protein